MKHRGGSGVDSTNLVLIFALVTKFGEALGKFKKNDTGFAINDMSSFVSKATSSHFHRLTSLLAGRRPV